MSDPVAATPPTASAPPGVADVMEMMRLAQQPPPPEPRPPKPHVPWTPDPRFQRCEDCGATDTSLTLTPEGKRVCLIRCGRFGEASAPPREPSENYVHVEGTPSSPPGTMTVFSESCVCVRCGKRGGAMILNGPVAGYACWPKCDAAPATVPPPDPAGAAGEEARPSDAGKAAALYAAEYHRLRARLAESERTQERAFDAGYRKGFVAGYNHAPQPWAITGVCAMAADAAREYRAALTRETPP